MISIQKLKSKSAKALLFISTALPIFVVCYLSYTLSTKILAYQAEKALTFFAKKKTQATDDYIFERIQDARNISQLFVISKAFSKNLDKRDFFHLDSLVKNVLHESGFENLVLVNNQKKIIYSSTPQLANNLALDQLPEPVSYYKEIYDLITTLLSPLSIFGQNMRENLNQTYFTSPVFIDGKLMGGLILTLKSNVLKEELFQNVSMKESKKYVGAFFKNKLQMVYSNDIDNLKEALKNPQLISYLKLSSQGENGFKVVSDPNGNQVVYVYRYVPEMDMGYVMVYQGSEVYQISNWLKKQIIFLFIFGTLLVFYMAYLGLKKIKKYELRFQKTLKEKLPSLLVKQLNSSTENSIQNLKLHPVVAIHINYGHLVSDLLNNALINLREEIDLTCSIYKLDLISLYQGNYVLIAPSQEVTVNLLNLSFTLIDNIQKINEKFNLEMTINAIIDLKDISMMIIDKDHINYQMWYDTYLDDLNKLEELESSNVYATSHIMEKLNYEDAYQINAIVYRGMEMFRVNIKHTDEPS